MSNEQSEIGSANREWVHFIASDEVGTQAMRVKISPSETELSALCKRLNLHSINEIVADITLKRNNVNKTIHIKGIIQADLVQKCIITTEAVQEAINDEFEVWFADPNSAVSFAKAKRERMSRKDQRDLPLMDEEEDPDPVIDGKIDIGELVVQHLSLALNTYPKLEGAKHDMQDTKMKNAPEGTYNNPFAALKDWKSE